MKDRLGMVALWITMASVGVGCAHTGSAEPATPHAVEPEVAVAAPAAAEPPVLPAPPTAFEPAPLDAHGNRTMLTHSVTLGDDPYDYGTPRVVPGRPAATGNAARPAYYYRSPRTTYPRGVRTMRGVRWRCPNATPPVGGNWPSPKSYGPPQMK